MDLPTISVVVPTRDRPKLLLAAAHSAVAQTLPPLELIVVDDGGAAHAADALQTGADHTHIPLRIIPGPGRGPAAARNAGVAAARGDFIAFLDDDDLWLPEKLAAQAHWLARQHDLGALGTRCIRSPAPDGRCFRTLRRVAQPRPVSPAALVRANRLTLSSAVVRRACLADCGGFDESLPLAQDWDLWLRLSSRWRIAVLPAPLTIYRLHPDQRSRTHVAMRAWEVEVIRRALEREHGPGPRRAAVRRRLSWAHCRLGRLLMRTGEPVSAANELRQALSLFPFHPMALGSLALCTLAQRDLAGAPRP